VRDPVIQRQVFDELKVGILAIRIGILRTQPPNYTDVSNKLILKSKTRINGIFYISTRKIVEWFWKKPRE